MHELKIIAGVVAFLLTVFAWLITCSCVVDKCNWDELDEHEKAVVE